MSVHVLVFPRLKASKNLWYVLNGAPVDQCSLLPWAGPHCFRWRPFLALWAVGPGSLSVPAGSGVRVTALQSGRFSPGALQPSITAALECPGSRAPEGLLQAVLARGASPVVPTGCLPAAGMRCVHGLLLRNLPACAEELALSEGSVCSPAWKSPVCKEAGASRPGLSEGWGRAV